MRREHDVSERPADRQSFATQMMRGRLRQLREVHCTGKGQGGCRRTAELAFPFKVLGKFTGHRVCYGAAEGTRTPDPIITNDVLYHLSYSGDRSVGLTRRKAKLGLCCAGSVMPVRIGF